MKKYIPVFGDQSLFDDAPEDAVFVRYGKESYIFKESMLGCTIGSLRDAPIVAMRRIEEAPEPKRWTWEDKKAGRLPEVGAKCRQGHKDEIVIAVTEKFVVTECQDMSVCTTRKDVFMRSYNPIETPAEKAQRERDEWIDNACSFICFYDIGRVDAIKSLEITYDKLKSGELPMPKKDGE
jgi:hypothetical protein